MSKAMKIAKVLDLLGIHPAMPADLYHGCKEFLSNSMLSEFLVSPAHLQEYLKNPPEQTDAQRIGSFLHSCILEPEKLDGYAVLPELDKRTVAGKESFKAFCEQNEGKEFVKASEYALIEGAINSVYNHDSASAFLSGGQAEMSIFWEDELGVNCRCRPDYYRESDGTLIDVKTTLDARPQKFQRDAYNYGYYRQAMFYKRGLQAVGLPVNRVIIIAVEKVAPFALKVYELDPLAEIRGKSEVETGLRMYAECQKSGLWPAYTDGVEMLTLPAYA